MKYEGLLNKPPIGVNPTQMSSSSGSVDSDDDISSGEVLTPAQYVIFLRLEDTDYGRSVLEEEAAIKRRANFEKVTSWIEDVRSSAASDGMQGMLYHPPESERNEDVDLEEVDPQQEESGDNGN